MANKQPLSMEESHFVSPREREEQRRFLGHEAFELLMGRVDAGEMTMEAASAAFHESADKGDYTGILQGHVEVVAA